MPSDRLEAAISRAARRDGWWPSRVPRQVLVRYDKQTRHVDMTYSTMLCVVAAGEKRPQDATHAPVAAGQILLNLTATPVVASFSTPYRSVTLLIDLMRVAAIAADLPEQAKKTPASPVVSLTATAEPRLIDAVCRWVDLLATPEDIPALAERYEDEIIYRVLRGPLGGYLQRAASHGEHAAIQRAVERITAQYADRSLRTSDLAAVAGMGATAFHRHFRDQTGLTPSQYVKRLRLQRARQLLTAGETASAAAAKVGYVNPTHFSRDYSRQYGMAPRRHALQSRDDADSDA